MIKIKKVKRKILLIVIMLILVTLTISGYTLAKYVSNYAWNNYLESKGFYFNSEELSTNTTKNVDKNWDGNNKHFILLNSNNKSLITEYDISYNVKCEVISDNKELSCNLMDTGNNIYSGTISSIKVCSNNGNVLNGYTEETCNNKGYKWISDVSKKDIYFNIAGTNYNDVTVKIEVTSTKPYKKILNGEYILHKTNISDGVTINYNDFNNYGNLVITNTTNNDKNVLIEFNSNNLRIDNINNNLDNYNVDSNGIINNAIIKVNSNSNKIIKFYKSNKGNYSINDFNVSISE